ncbi:MAG: serine--tRNA ligase, partial [SAR324 cluster bacterium]|nr:serine--tRNA ligase [SAR324 cluster bacterium]
MLDLKLIRSQPEEIVENCRKRNVQVDIEKLLILDEQVRQTTTEVD